MPRCTWVPEDDALYQAYHDDEWGVPVFDERVLFEFLILESAQAGLSWRQILQRREGYRRAFAGFDPVLVAQFDQAQQEALLQDAGIIRNRLKIKSAVNNAQAFLAVQQAEGSFAEYVWAFVGGTPIQNNFQHLEQVPAQTPLSDKLSKDLKRRGFSFLGSTTCYAYMQAVGLVNDHLLDCPQHGICQELAKRGC